MAEAGIPAKRVPKPKASTLTYADAGVDITGGDRAKQRIKYLAQRTFNKQVLSEIGGFGGLFRLESGKFAAPVLVSSADGVGTKLKIAFEMNLHHTVGADLVNHCVNDIAIQGAIPLFFLDYLATGRLDEGVIEKVVTGLADACKANGCALIGGETAQMPGFYSDGEYDLAGFIVGVVDKEKLITGARIKPADILVGFPSTGLHTNGYSLARKLFFEVAGYKPDQYVTALKDKAGAALMKVHRSYLPLIKKLTAGDYTTGMAHITGGGITENLPRILPKSISAHIETGSWPILPIFEHLRELGSVEQDEMLRTFNLGIGLIAVIPAEKFPRAKTMLDRAGKKKLGILLSGRGSNFLAIADSIDSGKLAGAELAVVISNCAEAPGVAAARHRGIPALTIEANGRKRAEHDAEIVAALQERQVDLVCLAGYLRLLSPQFIQAFDGRILNIHPSLLPAFPGLDAQRQALEYGVQHSGCTVHFVDEQLDHGVIILQRSVEVLPRDTERTLSARILEQEHQAYPEAIARVLSGKYQIVGRRYEER